MTKRKLPTDHFQSFQKEINRVQHMRSISFKKPEKEKLQHQVEYLLDHPLQVISYITLDEI